ncbi:hypothetical protein COOONC_22553, partial [Cooperia oncophora]
MPLPTAAKSDHGTGKKAVLHLKGTPVKDLPSPATEEETPKVRLIARVPRSTSEDETDTSKPRKDHETSGLFSFWKSGGRKQRGDSQEGPEYHPSTAKYSGPLEDAPAPVSYKPAATITSEPTQHRAYSFGRWRHEGDEEIVEKDRVRPETYGIASTSYEGPLESTTRHSELPSAPLRDHAKAYHHGQSWDAKVKTPTAPAAEVDHGTGKKAVLHLKGTPVKDLPSPATEEETPKVRLIARVPRSTSEDETDTSKPRKDHETSGLFSFWKSGGRKQRGDSQEGPEYHPSTAKYSGPLEDVNRQRDIEQIPFKAPAPVSYKPAATITSEPTQHRAYSFGRWRHEGDEEIVEKDRVRPETYGIASTSYEGPLESTTRHSELPSAPLRDHAKAYHHGQSWDVTKVKTPTAPAAEVDHGTGKKAVLHLKGTPAKDLPSPATEEETPKVRLIARVPRSTSEDETDTSKPRKDHETSGLFSFWKSGGRKQRGDSQEGSEYPSTGKYSGPLEDVNRQRDIEQIPFKAPAPVSYKPAATITSEPTQHRAYSFGRWRHEGDEEIVEKDRVRPETYGIASTSYEGPLESTTRHSELPSAPLRDHAKAYHHGQSWDAKVKTPTAPAAEVDHGTGKKAVLHLKGTPVKDLPSPATEEETPKVRLIARVPRSTSEDETDTSKPRKDHETSGLFSFFKSGTRKQRGGSQEGSDSSDPGKHGGPKESVRNQEGIEQVYSTSSSQDHDAKVSAGGPESISSRTYVFGRWRHDAKSEGEKDPNQPGTYGVSSASYENPHESTTSQFQVKVTGRVRGSESISHNLVEDQKNSSSWTWARSSEGVKPTGDEESAGLRSGKDLPQRDSSEESERLIAVASSHTGRLEGRTLQGDEWVEVRVDRRAEVQLEPVFCLTGAGLRDLSEDEAGMIFSVTPPMPSSSRSFFSRLGFK